MDQTKALLKSVFGFDGFRPGQSEIVEAILAGRDVLAIMPTGGGKSLCYQAPALRREGLTLVVSPLIALMRDQVAQLRQNGVAAGALTSANDPEEQAAVESALADGRLKLLYLAPERLASGWMMDRLRRANVTLLAVDEAHCVSQWGHDFRPDYLRVGALREALGGVQTAALTATADRETRDDIAARLFASPPEVFLRGFDRPNLRLAFETKASPRQRIAGFAKARAGQSGIVYCASRRRTEELAAHLSAEGLTALPYHAGLNADVRQEHQDRFTREDGIVMTATVAFGMGVDKPDVRYVVHHDMPKTIESYYQEIGRAGRDGLPADTLTLYGVEDIKLRRLQIDGGEAPDARKRAEHQRLNALLALAEAPRCRRQTLLAYFDEIAEPCGNCDLCASPPELFDGTLAAQKALSAIRRTGERFGAEHVIAVLRGETNERVAALGHDALPTFGVGADMEKAQWRGVLRQLYAAGYASIDPDRHGAWGVTEAGWRVMKGEERVEMRKDAVRARPARSGARAPVRSAAPELEGVEAEAFLRLKALRAELAKAQKVPAYVIFPDRTLIEMATARPSSLADMAQIGGVGMKKLERYGAQFLAALDA
jgi:ATP-dependent DNA helicase RecQ